MDDLKLLEEWLANEKELRPLLDQMRPLLDKRRDLEDRDPRLVALRSPKELLPAEALLLQPSFSSSSASSSSISSTSILKDTGAPLVGLPPRAVPDIEKFQKMVDKKKAQNRKKHEKEKKKRAELKKAQEGPSDMNQDPS